MKQLRYFFGIHQNGKYKKLENLIVKTITALLNFIDEDYLSKECYDIWEERKGKHLYSTASIFAGLEYGKEMLQKIDFIKYKSTIKEIEKTLEIMKDSILQHFVENGTLKRSTNDNKTDISILSLVVPFNILKADDKLVENAVRDIENNLKLSNGGYLRYQDDAYIGGNAWIISTLWLALYYIEVNNLERANQLFDWVTNHADNLNFLPEQIDKNGNETIWVRQLSWSHAMYIIVRNKLEKSRGGDYKSPSNGRH